MKVLTSRVIVFAIMSVFTMEFAKVAHATTPAADYKTVTSKAYVDEGLASKQNQITTGLVEFNENPNYMLPAITTYDSTSGLVSNKIGILDYGTVADDNGWLSDYSSFSGYGAEMDNFVPTVRAVAEEFAMKQGVLPAKSTGDLAPKGNQAVVLNGVGNPSWVYTTAGKDLAITTKSGAQRVMNYVDGTTVSATFASGQGLTEAQVQSTLVSLELLKDVYSALSGQISNATGTLTWDSAETASANAYETHFGNGTNYWPVADENKLVDGAALANALALKQNKIPATEWQDGGGANIPGVVISTGTDGVVEQRMILDKTQDITDQSISTLVANGYDEGNTGSITYDIHDDSVSAADVNSAVPTTTMTVAIANAAAATKQDEITTGLVEFNENPNYMLPAITTYDSTSGLVSNKIGILDYGTVADDNGWLSDYSSFSGYGAEMDNFVPTVRAVAEEFVMKQGVLPAKSTGDLAPRGNQAFVANTLGTPSKVYTTAGKDLVITAKSGAQRVMNYVDGTTASATFASGQGITEAQVKSTLVSLELLKDVYDRVKRPTGTTGKVVTYNGLNANNVQQFSEATIAHNLTYTTGANPTVSNLNDIASVELVLNNAGNYQPIIQPSAVSGATQIITKPAYGGTAGDISYLTLDTASLTDNNAYVPSSKLVSTQLDLKLDKTLALTTTAVNTALTGHSSTANLYTVPSAVSNGNWASTIMNTWSTNQNVPTMDTLANSLAGVYAATQDYWTDNTRNYDNATSEISGADIAIPRQIAYTGQGYLSDGNQLVWLPALVDSGNEAATVLIKSYNDRKTVPTMDELAYALDGVLQTNETSDEWRNAGRYYHAANERTTLYELADDIENRESNAVAFNASRYLQTFAPTLSALMDESYALFQEIDTKQTKLSGTEGNVVTYGATGGSVGSKAIDTTVTSASSNLVTSGAVYTADLGRQNKIPAAGSVRSANNATTNTTISDWTSSEVKGTALVTKTSTDGVVGERKIFEPGDTYTNDAATNIQIATIGAVKENTLQKTCAEYKPGTTVANQNAENCWLWTISNITAVTTTGAQACSNPRACRNNSDCCGGYVCNYDERIGRNTCVVQEITIDES